jgi:hypothetical protein
VWGGTLRPASDHGRLPRVDSGEFDARLARLLTTLEEAVSLLVEHGAGSWAAWLDGDRWRIENGDRHGLDHLLETFGGMGSLNDLVFHPLNGNASGEDPAEWDNDTLSGLRARIFTEASALRSEFNRP